MTLLGAPPAAAQDWASSYTKHDYAKCPKAKPDEDGVSVRRCPGKAGIAVTWTAGDDASFVELGTKPVEEGLSDKAGFFEAGSTIEWRGPKAGKPQATILRYAIGQAIGKLDGSLLVVYRLGAEGASCIIGSVDGRGRDANAQARRLADGKAASFRCGQDQRSDR
ncbi:hypothetical protein DWF00_26780 [Bosea caraganae]|uniref:Uncharacterized protein n=1 Tax=Bosea caraganae TaxID=2763117 RepID=A0A370L9Q4_9HYPH|nr:hypothetical protein DWF00_26780 [Bosea caraganae]RDJ28033.1 hypothetical protein DWE98_05375 [Bosea caraganae]